MSPLLFLLVPAAISVGWVLALLLRKRRRLHAHWLLALSQLLEAFTLLGLVIYLEGGIGSRFIYDYIFELTATLCLPIAYLGICSLTEARGPSRAQRWVLIWPLIFITGLTVGAFVLGPRRYDMLLTDSLTANTHFIVGDRAWNFMLLWDVYLFWVLLVVQYVVLIWKGVHRMNLFIARCNSLYAAHIGSSQQRLHPATILSIAITPAMLLAVGIVIHTGLNHWAFIALLSVVLSLTQWRKGYDIYHLRIDARALTAFVKKNIQ